MPPTLANEAGKLMLAECAATADGTAECVCNGAGLWLLPCPPEGLKLDIDLSVNATECSGVDR